MRGVALLVVCGCGRIGFEPSPGELVLTSLDDTTVPAGASVRIQPALTSAAPGTTVELVVDRGTVRTSAGSVATEGAALVLTSDAMGAFPELKVRIPLEMRAGELITISADRAMTGDTELVVIDPTLRATAGYELAEGFDLEVVATSPVISGRQPRLVIPSPTSAFEDGIYAFGGGGGMLPAIARFTATGAETVITTGTGPDEGIAQVAFAPEGYGDRIYVCSASIDAGDGIFTLSPTGQWTTWASFNNCNGLTFDRERILGDAVAAPMYVNIGSSTVSQGDPAMTLTQLDSSLPVGPSGWKLYVHAGSGFPAGLYMVFPLDNNGGNGQLRLVTATSPWSSSSFATFDEPNAAAFGTAGEPFGDLLFVGLRSGAIIGARPDLSTFTFASGIPPGGFDLLFAPDGSLYAIGNDGRLLRIVPER